MKILTNSHSWKDHTWYKHGLFCRIILLDYAEHIDVNFTQKATYAKSIKIIHVNVICTFLHLALVDAYPISILEPIMTFDILNSILQVPETLTQIHLEQVTQ